jgi:hypothetical protein
MVIAAKTNVPKSVIGDQRFDRLEITAVFSLSVRQAAFRKPFPIPFLQITIFMPSFAKPVVKFFCEKRIRFLAGSAIHKPMLFLGGEDRLCDLIRRHED